MLIRIYKQRSAGSSRLLFKDSSYLWPPEGSMVLLQNMRGLLCGVHFRIPLDLVLFLLFIVFPVAAISSDPTIYQSPKAGFLSKERLVLHGLSRFLQSTENEHFSSAEISETAEQPPKPSEQRVGNNVSSFSSTVSCRAVRRHIGYENSCSFLSVNKECSSGSMIDYTRFFFCTCRKAQVVGFLILIAWLVALFYMLGNTAADYFCCSLEKLSKLLRCPATVAGVTLLPLGNGAPDVFASIAAFIGADVGEVGLNSVLGGAVFVTSVVIGSVSLIVAGSQSVKLDRRCFIRDVCFFLFTLLALLLILLVGYVPLWGALAFLCIYVLYAVAVGASEFLKKKAPKLHWHPMQPLPFTSIEDDDVSLHIPLIEPELLPSYVAPETSLPQWMWMSNVAIYSQQSAPNRGETARSLWGWDEEQNSQGLFGFYSPRCICRYLIEWPLNMPRRLTIPVVERNRWSHGFAVASAGLAPIFLSLILQIQDRGSSFAFYAGGIIVGGVLSFLAFFTTKPEHPPRRFLFPWVLGGFLMSILWFYVLANELVGLLITFGTILEIDPSVLGLTVLAWGNSMGDLMANIALASNGGDGVQIAVSGCYAGPMFNTLIGLGVSLTLGSWKVSPAPYLVPKDYSLYYTLAFLVIALLWALIVLPANGMQPSKMLGIGLLILYVLFLLLRLGNALGYISLLGVS